MQVEIQECSVREYPARHVRTQAACRLGHRPALPRHVRVSVQVDRVSVQVVPASVRVRQAKVAAQVVPVVAVAVTKVAAQVVPVVAVPQVVPEHPEVPLVAVAEVVPEVAQHVGVNRSGRSVKSLTIWRHRPSVARPFPWATGNQSRCLGVRR